MEYLTAETCVRFVDSVVLHIAYHAYGQEAICRFKSFPQFVLLQGVRRLLLLPDQTGASSAAHLQLGSAGAGSNVSQGDKVDGGQILGPTGQGQGEKHTRVQGVQQAPLVALEATSFLDMGASSEAVQPAAAPSHGKVLPSLSWCML